MTRYGERLRHNSTRFDDVNSEELTYVRKVAGVSTNITIQGCPILHPPEDYYPIGSSIRIERQCFSVNRSWLVLDSVPFLPSDSDTIIRGSEQYRVIPPDPNTPHYRYVTNNRERVLIMVEKIV
jgi:hypothetical protein